MAAASACIGSVEALIHRGRSLKVLGRNVVGPRSLNASRLTLLSTGKSQRRGIYRRIHASAEYTAPISENQGAIELADGIVDSVTVAAVLPHAVEVGVPKATLESVLPHSPVVDRGKEDSNQGGISDWEVFIERKIFDCRFFTLMAVFGSLAGSFLCFSKGCLFVFEAFREYSKCFWQGLGHGKVIVNLIEAVDVYLVGTVMLIFGMGLYELFVSSLDVKGVSCDVGEERRHDTVCGSNLFGLFRLSKRPKWLEIHSLDELKTKLGHVIVMILLVGMFEKSKHVPVHSAMDLLAFSLSILMSSGSLYLLNQLTHEKKAPKGATGQ